MKTKSTIVVCFLLVGGALAQQPMGGPPMRGPQTDHGPGGPGGGRGLDEAFFPAELVMRNQKAIGLSEEQRSAIRAAAQKAMGQFAELQWQLSAEEEALGALVKEQAPDETKALAQLDKVLALEAQMKRLQLGLMIAIKANLTPEQQAQLDEIKKRDHPPRPDRPPREGGEGPPP
ncbi:MAG: periplasmic heavy metal sensor [Chthoniobacterales bacterium]|jgi:Spy/CpxP family protein refolding chaperone